MGCKARRRPGECVEVEVLFDHSGEGESGLCIGQCATEALSRLTVGVGLDRGRADGKEQQGQQQDAHLASSINHFHLPVYVKIRGVQRGFTSAWPPPWCMAGIMYSVSRAL